MNEVRATQVGASVAIPAATRTASSEGVDEAVILPPDGKQLPAKETAITESSRSDIEIDQAVTEINDYVQSIQRDLHFSIDEDSGITIVRVRDKESGELIRQIPEDIFLNLAQKLKENQPIHLFDAHG